MTQAAAYRPAMMHRPAACALDYHVGRHHFVAVQGDVCLPLLPSLGVSSLDLGRLRAASFLSAAVAASSRLRQSVLTSARPALARRRTPIPYCAHGTRLALFRSHPRAPRAEEAPAFEVADAASMPAAPSPASSVRPRGAARRAGSGSSASTMCAPTIRPTITSPACQTTTCSPIRRPRRRAIGPPGPWA